MLQGDCKLALADYTKRLVGYMPGLVDCTKKLGHCRTRWQEVNTTVENRAQVQVLAHCKTGARTLEAQELSMRAQGPADYRKVLADYRKELALSRMVPQGPCRNRRIQLKL